MRWNFECHQLQVLFSYIATHHNAASLPFLLHWTYRMKSTCVAVLVWAEGLVALRVLRECHAQGRLGATVLMSVTSVREALGNYRNAEIGAHLCSSLACFFFYFPPSFTIIFFNIKKSSKLFIFTVIDALL